MAIECINCTLFLLWYNEIGDKKMTIAVDKKTLKVVKNKKDYVYVFTNEKLQDLLDTGLHCIRLKECKYVDINLTDYNIDCFKKAKITDIDYDKLPEKKDFKIGIIIPNYNYEHTIEKCLNSIAEQTYKNYEVIFVDDMSTDNSVKIAESFKDILTDIKIIRLKQKRLNGGARNEGYLYLSDDVDYIYYVDSDDWLKDKYSLEKINNKLQKKPDVLFVGMDVYKNNTESLAFIPQYKDKYEALEGWSGSCGKAIRKGLATRQECLYNEGTLKEDKNQHCRICYYMNSFELLQEPVYVWNRQNNKSVTTIREQIVWGTSTIRHYADTLQMYLTLKGKDRKIDDILKKRVDKMKKELTEGGDRQW